MTWAQAVDAIAEKVTADGISTRDIERLAREIPLHAPTTDHAAVGAALERVLGERYRAAFGPLSDAEVFAAGTAYTGEEYRDRVDRARSDAMHRSLEERHPELGDPGDSFLFHPDGTTADWRAHLRTFYGLEDDDA